MMNDECGMMNENQFVFNSSFIIPHSALLFYVAEKSLK